MGLIWKPIKEITKHIPDELVNQYEFHYGGQQCGLGKKLIVVRNARGVAGMVLNIEYDDIADRWEVKKLDDRGTVVEQTNISKKKNYKQVAKATTDYLR